MAAGLRPRRKPQGRLRGYQDDSFKIAIIGAGSVGFTKKLVSDILKVPEFAGIEIALTDINAHNLDIIAQIIRHVGVNGLPATVTATTDRRTALAAGAMS